MRQESTKRQDTCTWCSFYVWSFLLMGMLLSSLTTGSRQEVVALWPPFCPEGLYIEVCSWYNERNPGGLGVYYISVKELRC